MSKFIILLSCLLCSVVTLAQEDDLGASLQMNLEAARASNDYYELAKAYCKYNIARQLLQTGMTEDAKERLTELQQYYTTEGDNKSLALVELQLFDYYFDKLDVAKAKSALDSISSRIDFLDEPPIELGLISRRIAYHELMKEYKEALVYANLCLQKSDITVSSKDYAECLLLKGRVHYNLKKYEEAIADILLSHSLLQAIPYSKKRLLAYDLLAKTYSKLEQTDEAYLYAQRYASLQDSILNEKRLLAINNLTYKYESKEKAAEIKLLEKDKAFVQQSIQQQKRALIVLGVALGGLILGIYYIIRFYSDKIKSAKIIEEQNKKINQQKITELQDRIQINSMQSMITGQEVERERIAKDLHDSLGGLLSTIKLQVSSIKSKEGGQPIAEVDHATRLLDVAVSEIRTISQDLQPGALKRLGLVSAINDLVNRYQSSNGPEISFQHYDLPREMEQGFAMGIYRIVQEILNNAIKHAQATEIFVQLNMEEEIIVIHIEDDGIGFDPDKKYESMGLANIRSRVNYLKGSIDIDSRIGEGTSYIIHLSRLYQSAGHQPT